MLKAKVKQKRDWAETKNEGFWADFFRIKKVKRVKGLTRNSRKSSKIKGLVTIFFKKNERTEKEKKKNCRKRKNRRCLLQFVGKKQHFSDTSKLERNKWETECLKEEKENNKGELRQKRETISQDTEKQYKAWKINVKHVQQKRERDKSFLGTEENRKRKFKRQSKTKKKRKLKIAKKSESNEKTRRDREDKWIEDEQKEGIKRQSRHSKRENVELVEVNVKSSRSEVSKWVNTNFQWQSFLWWSEKTGRRRKDFYQKKRRQQTRFSKKRGFWKYWSVCERRKKKAEKV